MLRLAEGIVLAHALCQVVIEEGHELTGGFVVYFPKAHEQTTGTRFLESTLQSEDPVAAYHRCVEEFVG